MSYVNNKIRVFRDARYKEHLQRRSEGRMKTYKSETDARSWCNTNEDRRQHILKLIREKPEEKGLPAKHGMLLGAVINALAINNNQINNLETDSSKIKSETYKKTTDDALNEKLSAKPAVVAPINSKDKLRENLYGKDHLIEFVGDNVPDSKLTQSNLLKDCNKDCKLVNECNKLKETLRELKHEKRSLRKQVQECECQVSSQKKKIEKLVRHIDSELQHRKLRKPTTVSTHEGVPSNTYSCNEKEIMVTKPLFVQSSKDSTDSRRNLISRSVVDSVDVWQNINNNHIRTKLELERRKCTDIVERLTKIATNIQLDIELIKKSNCERNLKYRNSTSNSFNEEDDEEKIDCTCPPK